MKYTDQAAFDAVLDHSRKQPFQALSPNGHSCLYRAAEGAKCFIGALMPDDVYDGLSDVERRSCSRRLMHDVKAFVELFEANINRELIDDLQCVHDTFSVARWERELADVAKKYDLKFTPLEVA